MDGLTKFIKTIGLGRLVSMMVVLIITVGLMTVVSSRLGHQGMRLLYGGLQTQETSAIVTKLDSLGVPYEIRGDSQVFVPQDQVGTLRIQLAGEGLVGSSTSGYEIFDNASSFGTTALVQNINARRALEGELARTITSLPVIKGARVHVVLPKRQLFSRNQTPPTASVTLDLGSRQLEGGQIDGIVHMVAAAVPNLKASNVTVVDNLGNLLSSSSHSSPNNASASPADMFRQKLETEYADKVTKMLERIVGPGRTSVKVSADVNFDRVEENSEIFDPNQQVPRSQQVTENRTERQDIRPGAPAGLAANVPGQGNDGTQIGSNETTTRTEETTNFEISRTVRNFSREGGEIKKLSIAVLLEGDYVTVDGEQQYTPLDDDRRNQLEALVKTAIGFNEERGDQIELIDMPFKAIEEIEMVEEPFLSKADIINLVEYGLLFLGFILIMFMVVRPLLAAMQTAFPAEAPEPVAAAPDGDSIAAEQPENMIDLEKVEGRVRESTLKKVNEIVDTSPDQSVSVVRSWMSPES